MTDKQKLKLVLKTLEKIEAEAEKQYFSYPIENIKHWAKFAIKIIKDENIKKGD